MDFERALGLKLVGEKRKGKWGGIKAEKKEGEKGNELGEEKIQKESKKGP